MFHAIRALAAVLAIAALTGSARGAETTPAGADFRAEAETDKLSRRGPAVSGWLYNDKTVAVSNVRLQVDVLDASGEVVASAEGWIYGNVPGRGRAYFFVVVPRLGGSYRVTVLRFDRLEMGP